MCTEEPINTTTSRKKKKQGNVITVAQDFSIMHDKYVDVKSSIEIDQEDCRIVDAIIQYQRDNLKDPTKQISNIGNAFKTRRNMVEIQKNDKQFRVRSLSLANAVCDKLPICIVGLDALEILDLSGAHKLEIIPAWIGKLSNLRELHLPKLGKFTSLPDSVWDLTKLEVFSYAHWNTNPERSRVDISIPPSIGKMTSLRELRVAEVTHLPEEIGNLADSLECLDLPTFKGTHLPESIGKLSKLRALIIQQAPLLRSLPESIGNLQSLKNLSIQQSGLQSLPNSIGNLKSLRCLNLEQNMLLEQLPDSIGDLERLNALSLDSAGIKSIPTSVKNLSTLSYLNLKTTNIRKLPNEIGSLSNLFWLELAGSRIASLPEAKHLKNMRNLKFLKLHNTVLSSKPSSKDKLREIALELPMLGCFGPLETTDTAKELAILLSYNRACHRIFHPLNKNQKFSVPKLSLWPKILANTKSACAVYPHCDYRFKTCGCCDTSSQCQSDAIFRLLKEYGSTFLCQGTN